MPPAGSDDLFQHSRSLGDNIPFPQDPSRLPPEHEPSGKNKKKGKNGSKGKDKAGKAATKTPSPAEDLIDPSPPLQTEPSSCPNPSLNHHAENHIVSPVLDALGSLAETPDNDIAYRTGTWAKSIPFGKSPPTDVIDGEFASGSPLSFPTNAERGGFSNPSSTSPPPRRRPLSYNTGYLSSNSNVSRQQSADRQKSHSVSTPYNGQVPPPHLPQAHFYGAPDVDIPLFSGQNRTSTDGSYSFCAFDSIPSPSYKTSRMGGSVLLAGTDGALEVLAMEDRKTRLIGKLSGLNGRVIGAKMLTANLSHDPFLSTRPHVAVILHGPCVPNDDEGHASSAASEVNDGSSVAAKRSNKEDTKYYQTRVEIYSLRSGEHITTLFTTKPVPYLENIPGMPTFAPGPVGNLRLHTSGNFVVLASGVSGEVYIYGINPSSDSGGYQCYGKTWTTVQTKGTRRYSTSSSSTDPDGSRNDSPNSANSESPILALKGRWLAIVPPSSTHTSPLHGSVPPSLIQGKVFGLETRSPPSRPTVNCATDVGEGESLFDKVARGVAQELVRGARWMGDQGMQAWNNYWNKEQSQNQSGRRPANVMDGPQQGYNAFPPTHAQDTQTASPTEPDLVSIIDIKRLEDGGDNKNAFFNPVATFQVPNGCSFLSFSPNGLMLFTASKKGDVQYVWDLLQTKYCRAGAFLTEDLTVPCANVRQIARYTRLTTSRIVDVIWTAPTGDRLAIITRKGTVHVFDMPRSAFQWPPFRRARPVPGKTSGTDSPADDLSDRANGQNPLSAAFKLVGGRTQPILAAVRRTPSTGSAFPAGGFGITSAAGVRSGKAVAAGLSKSVGAATGTVNTLRHVGENRLHLPGLSRDPVASRVTWITHRGQPFLGLVDNGAFRLYRIRRTLSTNKHRSLQSVIGGREIEYKLPAILQNPCGPMPVASAIPESNVHASLALPSSNPQPSSVSKAQRQPLSQAEIETNVPYQPFHTDQRVNLFVLSPQSEVTDSMLSDPTGQWVFGDEISTTKLHVRPFSAGGDDSDEDTVHEHHSGFGGDMENLISLGNSTGNVEEVVITTRRKKKHSSFPSTSPGADMDDGFFEDDCEVLDFARDRV